VSICTSAAQATNQRIPPTRFWLRSSLCPTNVSTIKELSDSAEKQLFEVILSNSNHFLQQFLHPISACTLCTLEHTTNNYWTTHLTSQSGFITRNSSYCCSAF